jgi:release factor glutamine methyltransferase
VTRALSAPGLAALLSEAVASLERAGVETARQDAEWLLASVLGVGRFAVYLRGAGGVAPTHVARYAALVARRARREPLQHLLGFEEFHGLRIAVTRDVLVPRPETEGLVAWAVEILRERSGAVAADIGTGSGAIACALASALPGLEVLAVERAPAALEVAAGNIARLGLSGRVRLLAGDLLEPVGAGRAAVDLVVANLPYLPSGVIATLPPEVSGFEPREALDGGPDGMAVLRRLVVGAPPRLEPGGWLLMEIGEAQARPIAALMAARGFSGIQVRRDLCGVERHIGGRWTPAPAPGRAG